MFTATAYARDEDLDAAEDHRDLPGHPVLTASTSPSGQLKARLVDDVVEWS